MRISTDLAKTIMVGSMVGGFFGLAGPNTCYADKIDEIRTNCLPSEISYCQQQIEEMKDRSDNWTLGLLGLAGTGFAVGAAAFYRRQKK